MKYFQVVLCSAKWKNGIKKSSQRKIEKMEWDKKSKEVEEFIPLIHPSIFFLSPLHTTRII